jgi:metallo-beta-lactamase family protein
MVAGADRIKIHGAYVPVRAEVQNLGMLSAHADRDEILRWLRGFSASPSKVFIVHGEPDASEALRVAIGDELGWDCDVPGLFDEAGL